MRTVPFDFFDRQVPSAGGTPPLQKTTIALDVVEQGQLGDLTHQLQRCF